MNTSSPLQLGHRLLDDTLKLTFPGDISSTTAATLRDQVFNLMAKLKDNGGEWRKLTLDLTAAKMVDSAGLNLVVHLIREAKSAEQSVSALVADRTVHRTFLFTRLDKQVEVILKENATQGQN